jgi:hypothetical protein
VIGRFLSRYPVPCSTLGEHINEYVERAGRTLADDYRRAAVAFARLSRRRPLGPRDGLIIEDLPEPGAYFLRAYRAVIVHGARWGGPRRASIAEAVADLANELEWRLKAGDADLLDHLRDSTDEAWVRHAAWAGSQPLHLGNGPMLTM